jgi:hypothetical protein
MDEYPESYYTQYEAMLGWFACVAAPIWAAVVLIPGLHLWDIWLTCGLVVILLLVCLICAGVMVAAFPIRISESGIRSYDVWGRYLNVPWSEITSVEQRNYLGFRFLRIASGNEASVLVTLRIRNPDLFLMRVSELAGPENRLTQALERERARP